MRFKIKLKLEKIYTKDIAIKTSSVLNKLLGKNHKWHKLPSKPYTCSLIRGGEIKDGVCYFKDDSAYFYINTNDDEVIDALLNNGDFNYDIENIKIFSDYNLLSVKNVIYNTNGKENFITDDNKENFIKYVKQKYFVDIEIYKISTERIGYKNNSSRRVSNLLIKCKGGGKIVKNLFESGIGGSCSIGFGFVDAIKQSI